MSNPIPQPGSGDNNIALGFEAGLSLTSGSNNIDADSNSNTDAYTYSNADPAFSAAFETKIGVAICESSVHG